MANIGEEELAVLQEAADAYPRGLDCGPGDADYAAFVRCYDAGWLTSSAGPKDAYDGTGMPHYRRCTITEAGREKLDHSLSFSLEEGKRIIIVFIRLIVESGHITQEEGEAREEAVHRADRRETKKWWDRLASAANMADKATSVAERVPGLLQSMPGLVG